MTREEAIKLIDDHKNKLVNPVEMLNWTWLRVIIANINDDAWERALNDTVNIIRR